MRIDKNRNIQYSIININQLLNQVYQYQLAIIQGQEAGYTLAKWVWVWSCACYSNIVPATELQEIFEDAKGVIKSRKSKKDRRKKWPKNEGQNDKQWSTKHYIENCWNDVKICINGNFTMGKFI